MMKRLLLLLTAVSVILLCACQAAPEPVPTDVSEAQPVNYELPQTSSAPKPTQTDPESEPESAPEQPPDPVPPVVTVAVTDGSFDEVCSYAVERPVLNDGNAYPKINAFFEDLEGKIVGYIGGTVYDTALERGCIANAEGKCSWKADEDVLRVNYTLTVSYSDSDTPEINTRTDRFDLRTEAHLPEDTP